MKSFLRFLACAGLALGAASLSFAGAGLQHWQTLHEQAQFNDLKTGDKVAYVCNMCKSVTETTISSPEQAMAQCKEGATVTCPMCHATTKVVLKRARNDAPSHTEVVYVDDKGQECMFLAKVSE
jgi:hypothetical protein